MFARFRLWLAGVPPLDTGAKEVLRLANQAAVAASHRFVGPSHIMLGLLDSDVPDVKKHFDRLNIDRQQIRFELISHTPSATGDAFNHEQHAFARWVIDDAVHFARSWNKRKVGADALLWALAVPDRGLTGVLLARLGLTRSVIENFEATPRSDRK